MPSFTIPLHESNDCHNPAGPGGGRFCGKTVFHGTLQKNLSSILKTGLTLSRAGKTFEGASNKAVYVTTTRKRAREWAELASNPMAEFGVTSTTASDLVEFEIRIPPESASRLKSDRNQENEMDLEFQGNIPSQWIRAVRIGRFVPGKKTVWKRLVLKKGH